MSGDPSDPYAIGSAFVPLSLGVFRFASSIARLRRHAPIRVPGSGLLPLLTAALATLLGNRRSFGAAEKEGNTIAQDSVVIGWGQTRRNTAAGSNRLLELHVQGTGS